MLLLAIGLVIGLVLGLTGAGGSVLAVPLLMAGMGWSLPQAAPIALLAVCMAAATGAWFAWRKSYVRYRAAALMAALGWITAPLGVAAAHRLPQAWSLMLLSALLVWIAVRLWRQVSMQPQEAAVVRGRVSGDALPAVGPLCRMRPETGRLAWTRPCALLLAATGALTGFLSGMLGVGGGFVIVPSLRRYSELSMHSAVATSLLAIALTSGGAVVAALMHGAVVSWSTTLPFVGSALAGMLVANRLAPRLAGATLQQGFALLLGAVALYVGWGAIPRF